MLRFLTVFGLILCAFTAPAIAALSRAQLDSVGVHPPAGAGLDLGMAAPDTYGNRRTLRAILNGKPAFLNFVDYTCNTLCGTDLMLLADGIHRAKLNPANFRILVIGIDPKDSVAAATKMENDEIPPELRASTVFLLPDAKTIARATASLGFHYVYDPEMDQFAHPAIVYVLAPDGKMRALLSPLSLTAGYLRQDLVGPPAQPPSFYSRLHTLCYAYDPATGIYSLRINAIMQIAGVATLLAMAGGIGVLAWRRRAA